MLRPVQSSTILPTQHNWCWRLRLVKGERNVLGPYEFRLDENVLAAIKAIAPYMGYHYQEDATYLWLLPSEPRTVVTQRMPPELPLAKQ